MSARRELLRRNLRAAGWRNGAKRARGKSKADAAHEVAVVLGVLRARDRMTQRTPPQGR